jgi:cell division protein FtsB
MRRVSDHSDHVHRRDHSVWDFLNRLGFLLLALVVIAITIVAFLPKLKMQRDQTARLDHLKADIEKQAALLTRHNREVDLLQHDRSYVEMVARDRLDMMKDGETIYRIEAQPTPDSPKTKRREK